MYEKKFYQYQNTSYQIDKKDQSIIKLTNTSHNLQICNQ